MKASHTAKPALASMKSMFVSSMYTRPYKLTHNKLAQIRYNLSCNEHELQDTPVRFKSTADQDTVYTQIAFFN